MCAVSGKPRVSSTRARPADKHTFCWPRITLLTRNCSPRPFARERANTRESRWKVLKTEIKSNKFNFKQYAKTSEILKVFLTKDFVEAHRCPRRIFPAYVCDIASRREKQQTTQTHLNAAEGKLYPGVATLARVSSTISWLVERLSSESEREKLSVGRRRAGTAPGKSETNKVRGKKEREMQPRV